MSLGPSPSYLHLSWNIYSLLFYASSWYQRQRCFCLHASLFCSNSVLQFVRVYLQLFYYFFVFYILLTFVGWISIVSRLPLRWWSSVPSKKLLSGSFDFLFVCPLTGQHSWFYITPSDCKETSVHEKDEPAGGMWTVCIESVRQSLSAVQHLYINVVENYVLNQIVTNNKCIAVLWQIMGLCGA